MAAWHCALITGASGGIGQAFAEALAAQGCDLLLVARNVERLQSLAQRLSKTHGIRAEIAVQDLAQPAPGAALKAAADHLGFGVDLLINNAGFGGIGYFHKGDAERDRSEIAVNCAAVVDITHAFLPAMLQQRHGGIVNVASVAGFGPVPYMSVYSATKAFVLTFSRALGLETRRLGVNVLAVCPGPVDTGFFEATGRADARSLAPRLSLLRPEAVAEQSLRALARRLPVVAPGASSRVLAALLRLAPSRLLGISAKRIMRP